MKIEVYTLANNEERMMPYFMRHYRQFADVIIYNNNSTDRTVEIAQSMGATVINCMVTDEYDEQWMTNTRNNCWKESKADWVIVCDVDEFVYHQTISKVLEQTESTIFLPRFFNMFSETFPITEGQIYEEIFEGREANSSKMNLFKPSEITDINFTVGCHEARPEGNVKLNINSEIITLHMRHLSREYVSERNALTFSRMSELNKKRGWGTHFGATPEAVDVYMNEQMSNLMKIVW